MVFGFDFVGINTVPGFSGPPLITVAKDYPFNFRYGLKNIQSSKISKPQ